jgi:hypothetical protein
VREFDTPLYCRDADSLKTHRGPLIISHERWEEWGMGFVASDRGMEQVLASTLAPRYRANRVTFCEDVL